MFGNFNPYAPQVNPALQQQRLVNMPTQSSLGQQAMPIVQQPAFIKGRIVGSIEEVKGSPIDLDGSITYFPCPAGNCVYAKSIDNNGLPVIYKYQQTEEVEPKPKEYADSETVKKLQEQINSLEIYLKGGIQNANESTNNDANVQPIKE